MVLHRLRHVDETRGRSTLALVADSPLGLCPKVGKFLFFQRYPRRMVIMHGSIAQWAAFLGIGAAALSCTQILGGSYPSSNTASRPASDLD